MDTVKKYGIILLACLTLGLAPYVPEPHIVGKIRWILGGAHGMKAIDWWDTLQHGAPWLFLAYFLIKDLRHRLRAGSARSGSAGG